MQRNLFGGDSYKAQFAAIIYRQLMSRRWVTHADIMAEYMGLDSKKNYRVRSQNAIILENFVKLFQLYVRLLNQKKDMIA